MPYRSEASEGVQESGMPHRIRDAVAAGAPEGFELVGWCWPGPYGWLMSMMDDGGDPAPRKGLRPMYAPLSSDESEAPE